MHPGADRIERAWDHGIGVGTRGFRLASPRVRPECPIQQIAPVFVERVHRPDLLRPPVHGPAFVGPLEQRPFEVDDILDPGRAQLLGETGGAVPDRAVHDHHRLFAVTLERLSGGPHAGCADCALQVAGLELLFRPGVEKDYIGIGFERFREPVRSIAVERPGRSHARFATSWPSDLRRPGALGVPVPSKLLGPAEAMLPPQTRSIRLCALGSCGWTLGRQRCACKYSGWVSR